MQPRIPTVIYSGAFFYGTTTAIARAESLAMVDASSVFEWMLLLLLPFVLIVIVYAQLSKRSRINAIGCFAFAGLSVFTIFWLVPVVYMASRLNLYYTTATLVIGCCFFYIAVKYFPANKIAPTEKQLAEASYKFPTESLTPIALLMHNSGSSYDEIRDQLITRGADPQQATSIVNDIAGRVKS